MALTSIRKETCKVCGKVAIEKSRLKVGRSTIVTLMCNHLKADDELSAQTITSYESFTSIDGKSKLRQYQIDAVKFMEECDANCIIADEQGLGKTIQIQALLHFHAAELLPAILVSPTTAKIQWLHETIRWNGHKAPFTTQVINSGKEFAVPGFGIYIITYDLLKKSSIFDVVGDIKTIIIDEAQAIKNHLSDRAKAVQEIISSKNIKHVIPMSGTPIKNHAGEYFTILNLVKPNRFPHHASYVTRYCDVYESGWGSKIGGIRDIELFKTDTLDIILRRTKSEVLKDLPPKDRKFFHVALDRKLNKAYAAALDELDDLMYNESLSAFESGAAKIAIMSKLRHITGMSKVDQAVDFATEFLLSTDRKLTIFTHHQDVADLIIYRLNSWCKDGGFSSPLHLHSGLDGMKRQEIITKFKDTSARILIASTLAAGVAINLQFCSDAIMLERQWNPANEEQAEDRFHRFGQKSPVSITYMIASGTIDEFFTQIVEKKRAIVVGAMDYKEIQWDEQSLMKELTTLLLTEGRTAWKL